MLRCRHVLTNPVRIAVSSAVQGFGRRASQRRAMASDVREVSTLRTSRDYSTRYPVAERSLLQVTVRLADGRLRIELTVGGRDSFMDRYWFLLVPDPSHKQLHAGNSRLSALTLRNACCDGTADILIRQLQCSRPTWIWTFTVTTDPPSQNQVHLNVCCRDPAEPLRQTLFRIGKNASKGMQDADPVSLPSRPSLYGAMTWTVQCRCRQG